MNKLRIRDSLGVKYWKWKILWCKCNLRQTWLFLSCDLCDLVVEERRLIVAPSWAIFQITGRNVRPSKLKKLASNFLNNYQRQFVSWIRLEWRSDVAGIFSCFSYCLNEFGLAITAHFPPCTTDTRKADFICSGFASVLVQLMFENHWKQTSFSTVFSVSLLLPILTVKMRC